MSNPESRKVTPFPRGRRLITDIGHIRQRPVIRGLLEIDVTEARARIRAHKAQSGEALSFTGYLARCVGQAVAEHPHVHACRDWRGRLVIYDDVDISTLIEVERNGKRLPVGHIVRGANRKSVQDIHREIRGVQDRPDSERNVKRLLAVSRLPAFARRLLLRAVDANPSWAKRLKGTVVLTSVGMFGRAAGWGMALPTHSLGITVGGIAKKPRYVRDELSPREILHITLDFDHDLVDGAPAARFAQKLVDLIESADGLPG